MTILTKYVLKRPVTTIMCIICLIFFGYSSVTGATLELTAGYGYAYAADHDQLFRGKPRGRQQSGDKRD